MRIVVVAGARPNFMKVAPIMEALRARSEQRRRDGLGPVEQVLVHTGQHYDTALSSLFFEQLGLPAPDVNLAVGSGSHAEQTAEIMRRFEPVCREQKPTHVLVVGDVNSTIACALVAVKLGITVVHVEAGLRSFDRRMPEEINRVLTDAIADLLFTTEESATSNLLREGIPREKIHFVGNVMIDTLRRHEARAAGSKILEDLGLSPGDGPARPYGVLTLHRAETVDHRETLKEVLEAVRVISSELPIVFPVHPRTRARIEAFGLCDLLRWTSVSDQPAPVPPTGITAIEPVGYLEFLRLMSRARLVLTDSGGIQEETTILGIPCLTLRQSTERPVTISAGTNVLAGTSRESIVSLARGTMASVAAARAPLPCPALWDGKAAERIAAILVDGAEPTPSASDPVEMNRVV